MEQGVSFGDYRFEVETGRLWSGPQEVHLTPKASAVLAMLVARAGQPVSKKDLFATVWSDAAVSDDALTSCIQELRKAFADDARQPRFIETRHRRGYRFVAPLSEVRQRRSWFTLASARCVVHRRSSLRRHESRTRSGLSL